MHLPQLVSSCATTCSLTEARLPVALQGKQAADTLSCFWRLPVVLRSRESCKTMSYDLVCAGPGGVHKPRAAASVPSARKVEEADRTQALLDAAKCRIDRSVAHWAAPHPVLHEQQAKATVLCTWCRRVCFQQLLSCHAGPAGVHEPRAAAPVPSAPREGSTSLRQRPSECPILPSRRQLVKRRATTEAAELPGRAWWSARTTGCCIRTQCSTKGRGSKSHRQRPPCCS